MSTDIIFQIIADVGFPITAALLAGVFVYLVLNYILNNLLAQIKAAFMRFMDELRQKLQIKKQFGTYLSPALVSKLQKDPSLLKLGGESQELSIMFTDVRGFTTISEHYGKDVQGLTKIMNRYMTAMTSSILKNNGTLDKYIGDAQMAFWNAPIENKQHALDAVKTAFEMLNELETFNNEIAKEGIPPFGMGLGINTDTVVVGNMGSDQRFDYTCLGDGVNLASRLEGQSKSYGVTIILGEKTAEYIKKVYQVVQLDLIAVKGKAEPSKIYTAFESPDPGGLVRHKKFLECYFAGDWPSAKVIAEENRTRFSYGLKDYYEIMIERINMYIKKPPKKWDGIYIAQTK